MSYSGAESSMEDTNGTSTGNRRRRNNGYHHHAAEEGGNAVGDPEAWSIFADSFNQVQTVLDRNRALIQQANENHQSRIPDNMAKNVAIIQELNGNISKVTSIYSDLSVNFNGMVRQHRHQGDGSKGGGRRE